MPLQPGQILNNRYRIAKQIGQGGFGAVYRAWDTRMNGSCVVKENLETSQEARSQFEREAQILFRLRHSGLPVVFDYFSDPDQGLYLVMDFIEGKNLEEMQKETGGLVSEADAVNWISQVCDALEYLHGYNPPVIHRDIKPQNIIITPNGRAVLVDFGVAKLYNVQQKTTMGARAVTPGYSPPEQYLQTGTDARSDIYSLGATLYTLLSGQTPPESVALTLGDGLPEIHEFNSNINPALEDVVKRAMSPQKNNRFSTAAEMRAALHGKSVPTNPVPQPLIARPSVALQPAMPATMHVTAAPLAPAKPHKPVNGLLLGLGGAGALVILGIIAAIIILPGLLKDKSAILAESTKTDKSTEAVSGAGTPELTVAPTSEPTPLPVISHYGGWLDEIVVSVVDPGSAIDQVKNGTIDLYTSGLPAQEFTTIQAAGLNYIQLFGIYYDLTFNPVGPEFPGTGKLNPFHSAKIREAMNWLIDRNYLNQEIFAGKGLPKYLPITTGFPDYVNLQEKVNKLEAYYAYDLAKASDVITAEMKAMGAEKTGGQWMYKGEPVTLIFLIRNDSDGNRKPMGDYIADQLESIGFTVDRQYMRGSEARLIWVQGNAADGLFHLYTGGWMNTEIDRDQSDNFLQFYSPKSPQGIPLWETYTPTAEFSRLCDSLANKEYSNKRDQQAAMERALELAMQDSVHLWLMENQNFAPYNQGIEITAEMVTGMEGSPMLPYNLRYADEIGGQMYMGVSSLLVDPWNPIIDNGWSSDNSVIHFTSSGDNMLDPYTGLAWPLRIEKAEVVIKEGFLLVNKTLDWVELSFVPEIQVPGDAWVDWDAASQTFITADTKYPSGLNALRKTTVYYPEDMFDTITWHDGSKLSIGDFVFKLIMTFDRAKPESTIFDEQAVYELETFMKDFRGIKIVSEDPLIIEFYSDYYTTDAELNIPSLFPTYAGGEVSWAMLTVSNMAEANLELAYSLDKSGLKNTERTSYVNGPSLAILKNYLNQAKAESYIPFAPTLSKYVTTEEANERYANMEKWLDTHGHFWIGTGPYFIDEVDFEATVITLRHFDAFPDSSDRWADFVKP